jgi:predicted GNAT family N-acyltransferase
MSYHLVLQNWDHAKPGAQAVRLDVFVVEQHVPLEMEWDEMDAVCLHALVLDEEGAAVATGRLLPDGHIGRMAVRKALRGGGIGSMVLRALMDEARRRGDRSVLLSAQIHAAPFYARHGFVREGEEFIEAGIPHVCMRHNFD